MEWYEGLNEQQRLDVLGFTLGYLDSTVKGPCENKADSYVKEYAIRLLGHLKKQVGDKRNDKNI
ncbi:hypothetical protein [Peribacillus aracenensis]|uniref:hypothetical protein n=1 Tax=Peribacillus aracenensis TaxID=2976708 RepID=UPI0021A66360|nr:hypothetical protein [Peribacillus sp. BBB004]